MKDKNFSENKNGRIIWIDAVKAIGILLVIVGHGPNFSDTLWRFIWAFHMPLFFFVAGYTFLKKKHNREFIINKAKRLLIPYVFTTCMLMILDLFRYFISVSCNIRFGDCIKIVFRWLWGGLYGSCWSYDTPFKIYDIGAIWFLVTLFLAELMFNKILGLKKEYIIVIIVILGYIGLKSKEFLWLPWNIQASCVMLSIMYAGYFCREIDFINKKWGIWHILIGATAVLCIINDSMVIVGNNSYTYGCFSLIGAVALSLYFCKICCNIFNKNRENSKIVKGIVWLGKNTIPILCFHLLELDMMPWSYLINSFEPKINNLIIVLSKIIGLICIVIIINKTKILDKIFRN